MGSRCLVIRRCMLLAERYPTGAGAIMSANKKNNAGVLGWGRSVYARPCLKLYGDISALTASGTGMTSETGMMCLVGMHAKHANDAQALRLNRDGR